MRLNETFWLLHYYQSFKKMTTITRVLILLACFVAVSFGWTIEVGRHYFPDCSAQPSTYCRRDNCNIWYVDPVGGSVDGDGSSSKPWLNMTYVLNNIRSKAINIRTPYTGPVPIPDDVFDQLPDKNPTGVILPGDVVVLRGGDYPMMYIANYFLKTPITIMGEPGARPVVDRVVLSGTSNFIITCLNFTTTDTSDVQDFVATISQSYLAPSYYNVFTKNSVFCYPDINVFKGKPQDQIFKASIGGFITRDALYTEISYNYLYHIKRGFVNMSPYSHFKYNVVNYILGDGFRSMHNYSIIEHNLVMNSMNADNNADHRDGIQFFTNGNQFSLRDIIVRQNVFVADLDKERPFFSGFQGITCFTAPLYNITIENNLITTIWNWHGITIMQGTDVKIIGNTVLDVSGNRTFYPWISTEGSYSGITIQNNIAHATNALDGVANMNTNVFKRWTMQELQDLFVDPVNFNLRLKDNGSNPFIGTGNSTNAPTTDNDGNIRGGDYDVGCYAFHPLDPNTNAPTPVDNTPRSDAPTTITSTGPSIRPFNINVHFGAILVFVSMINLVFYL